MSAVFPKVRVEVDRYERPVAIIDMNTERWKPLVVLSGSFQKSLQQAFSKMELDAMFEGAEVRVNQAVNPPGTADDILHPLFAGCLGTLTNDLIVGQIQNFAPKKVKGLPYYRRHDRQLNGRRR